MWDWIAGTLPPYPYPHPHPQEKGIEGWLGHLTFGPDAALGHGVFNQAGLLWYSLSCSHLDLRGDPPRADLGTFVGRLDNPGECV